MNSPALHEGVTLRLQAFDADCGDAKVVLASSERVDFGASANIFLAEMNSEGKPAEKVALKVFPSMLSSTDQELLRRELAACRKARHPNILAFLGICEYDFRTILVSRYIPNGNLHDYLKKNPEADRAKLVLQVAEAVNFLHDSAGIVHGDLKCQNVLVSDYENALLADFGLATTIDKTEADATTMTSIRQCSTLRYCAPELLLPRPTARPRSKTKETDVYAFGMLVLQTFTGEQPWAQFTDMGVIVEISTRRIPMRPCDAKSQAAGFTEFYWRLCQRCWQIDPAFRPTMLRILDLLSAGRYWSLHSVEGPKTTGSSPSNRKRKRSDASAPSFSPRHWLGLLGPPITVRHATRRNVQYDEVSYMRMSKDTCAVWACYPCRQFTGEPPGAGFTDMGVMVEISEDAPKWLNSSKTTESWRSSPRSSLDGSFNAEKSLTSAFSPIAFIGQS